MKIHQRLLLIVAVLLFLSVVAGHFAHQSTANPADVLQPVPHKTDRTDSVMRNTVNLTLNPPETHPLAAQRAAAEPMAFPSTAVTRTKEAASRPNMAGNETCWQLLGNSEMDIFPIDGDTGTAEPWIPIVQQVYYDDTFYTSSDTSLVLIIDDDGAVDNDFLFVEDAFGQAFYMPDDLTAVYIEYYTSLEFANTIDQAFGEIWALDNNGYLQELIGWWDIDDHFTNPAAPPAWDLHTLLIEDPDLLNAMQDKVLAVIFDNYTTDFSPGEWIWFDDAIMIGCAAVGGPSNVYLPVTLNNVGTSSGPICLPPTETPQDSLSQNRGVLQTSALCESTMSSVDRQDYYVFKTEAAGNYTLKMFDLPSGTAWSGSVLIENPPSYAPGPTGGHCRIGTPGDSDKQVTCNLPANTEYIVKMSAGDYTGAVGSYKMRVTGP